MHAYGDNAFRSVARNYTRMTWGLRELNVPLPQLMRLLSVARVENGLGWPSP